MNGFLDPCGGVLPQLLHVFEIAGRKDAAFVGNLPEPAPDRELAIADVAVLECPPGIGLWAFRPHSDPRRGRVPGIRLEAAQPEREARGGVILMSRCNPWRSYRRLSIGCPRLFMHAAKSNRSFAVPRISIRPPGFWMISPPT